MNSLDCFSVGNWNVQEKLVFDLQNFQDTWNEKRNDDESDYEWGE